MPDAISWTSFAIGLITFFLSLFIFYYTKRLFKKQYEILEYELQKLNMIKEELAFEEARRDKIKQIFLAVDTDKDLSITLPQFHSLLSIMPVYNQAMINQKLKEFQENSILTFETIEFLMKEQFRSIEQRLKTCFYLLCENRKQDIKSNQIIELFRHVGIEIDVGIWNSVSKLEKLNFNYMISFKQLSMAFNRYICNVP